ncbi:ATP-dependent DNA helicase Pif1-like [Oratosquilla oratoria]|uniref:ATP-dependent DNA helicase Pif1-like n=1 Tax=Oratosquilla oratoria TaxID=337810 RepID=UPI003F762AEC
MPKQLRELFALICVFNSPANPTELFHQFEDQLIEDFLIQETRENAIQNALHEIQTTLSLHGLNRQDLQLPVPNPLQEAEVQIHQNEIIPQALITTLNNGQRVAFDEIVLAINNEGTENIFFFLDGPGGTGKTYLYNVIIRYLNSQNKCVLTYATTGIAADLLTNGRTAHSGFKLPIPLLETSTSSMRIPSPESEKIKKASLIIIDEASMLSGNALRVISNLLKEIMNSQRPFGGKVFLLGGDFRQTAPVIPRASDAAIIESSIKQSNLWRFVTKMSLTENMRIEGQQEFNRWLIAIGNGTISDGEEHGNDSIEIPQQMHSSGNIVQDIFGNSLIVDTNEEIEAVSGKIILTPKNNDALQLNNNVLDLIQGESTFYTSVDSIAYDNIESEANYPVEFLNSQTPSGMPPHVLKLKKGAIIMLLRNLNPRKGLLNGTRLIIISLNDLYIHGKIISGSKKGEEAFIPRIDLTPSDTSLPFKMTRRQFPVITAFTMTINKSQGQSFNNVGLYLPSPVFSHGQLYVALSRTRNINNLKILAENSIVGDRVLIKNIVLQELLQ